MLHVNARHRDRCAAGQKWPVQLYYSKKCRYLAPNPNQKHLAREFGDDRERPYPPPFSRGHSTLGLEFMVRTSSQLLVC